jgi:hypothetical protein
VRACCVAIRPASTTATLFPTIETLAKYAQALGIPQYVYFDNHYEGFVVASVERFRRLCATRGIETPLNVQLPEVIEPTLFDISPN